MNAGAEALTKVQKSRRSTSQRGRNAARSLKYFMDRGIATAQCMRDAQNRFAVLISSPKIKTLGGCE